MRNGWTKLWSDRAPLGYSLQLLTTDRPERQSRHGEETLEPDTLHAVAALGVRRCMSRHTQDFEKNTNTYS